jgi:hypothetical protein
MTNLTYKLEELDSPAAALRALGMRLRKLSNVRKGPSSDGSPKIYYIEQLRASEGTLSRWSRLHLQSLTLAPTRNGLAWWLMARSCIVNIALL